MLAAQKAHIYQTIAEKSSYRGDEIIRTETKKYYCLIDGLAANMPDVMAAVLNKGISRSTEQSEDSKQYYVS